MFKIGFAVVFLSIIRCVDSVC